MSKNKIDNVKFRRLLAISIGVWGLAIALALAHSPVAAQTGGGYSVSWSTIAAGGGASTGSGYQLDSIAGQPEAEGTLSGDGYVLSGGIWTAPTYRALLPLIRKP